MPFDFGDLVIGQTSQGRAFPVDANFGADIHELLIFDPKFFSKRIDPYGHLLPSFTFIPLEWPNSAAIGHLVLHTQTPGRETYDLGIQQVTSSNVLVRYLSLTISRIGPGVLATGLSRDTPYTTISVQEDLASP